MVADLREMQENQWVSEIQIDKFRFVNSFLVKTIAYGVPYINAFFRVNQYT